MDVLEKNLPPQLLSFTRKNKAWRKKHLDFADSKTFFNYSPVRKSVMHKKVNYDLLNGKLHMKDLMLIINPDNIQAGFIPDNIQHYPIMNSKLNVLRGEEWSRVFDYRVVVTNPNAISEIETTKKNQLLELLLAWVANQALSEEEALSELEKLNDYYMYEWQDLREVRANALLNHYVKEYNIPLLFNHGFMDAMTIGEEIYQCDIVGGEPVIERLDPLKVRVFKNGYSNRIEDADLIVIEDYWSPGKIIDTYYDSLSKKDMTYIEKIPSRTDSTASDSMGNIDERLGFIDGTMLGEEFTSTEGFFWNPNGGGPDGTASLLPYDTEGNIRVLKVYWKSRRKIKKVKSYDPMTGEETYTFYPETYVLNTDMGEEEEIYWINEAWEGIKIGADVYINMRPRVVQYNRLSNPSRCHFGIIGSIYNLNNNKPFSLVDMMKPYAYLYDVIKDRLNKLIARNWGMLARFDLSKKPKGWDVEKWFYYAKTMGVVVEDSFNAGMEGPATNKLAGALNNNHTGVINTSDGNTIQLYILLLEFIKNEMADVAGISKQREGQISNRETVGGVERATLQSSHITEWLFMVHDDLKRRVLECFLETAKIALKGKSKKLQYLLSDVSLQITDIDGDEFAESDYGLVVDNSTGVQELNQKLDTLAQAALQTQTLNFSTIMKLYTSTSMVEKQRMIEKNERELMQRQQEAQQQLSEAAQQQMQMQAQDKEADRQLKDTLNQRDNETKILVATMQSQSTAQDAVSQALLIENMRQFDEKLELEKERLEFDKDKAKTDAAIKRESIKTKLNKK